ncbi:MAG: hypothetical protein J5483_04385 [Lachnospiraceae bacterium]|nr:hypothetical protein [Lachnospiraceae bacterium]
MSGNNLISAIWGLLIPAIEQSHHFGKLSFLPAFLGFWLGIGFLLLLDNVIPHLHLNAKRTIGRALPYLLSFAAGAMIYMVVEELIPEMSEGRHSNIGVIMFAVGFTLMMTLDVALG